jgi:TP901 family phage tail tape measure protein
MAKGRIEKDDLASKDLFDNIVQGAIEAEKKVKLLEASLKVIKKTSDSIKGMAQNNKATNVKGINELNRLAEQSNILAQNRLKIDEQLKKEKQRLSILQADQNKQIKTSVEAEMKLTSQQEKELGTLQKLELENRKLRAERAKLNLETKEGTQRMREINAQLDVNNKKIKDSGDAMKQQKMNVGNYNGAISKLKGALNQLGLAFGVFQLLRGAGQTIVEFDSKVADLKAITGLKEGSKDLNLLKDSAIELGKQVQGGAKEVIEAYKLIGSAKPELLENASALDKVTKSAILLSQASGMELPASATALTDAMNQFGASADEADKFVNVLANGAKFGAVEIPQVTEALLKFGAVAKTSNVSIEESTALIEALGEKGQKGAEAGTALRNVMLKMSAPDALPKEAQERLIALGVSFDDLKDKSKPFSERLKALKPLLKDEASLVKVFGMENVVTAKNLLGSAQRIEQLNKQMKTNGTSTEQANERNKTLSFAINKVKESYNGYILKMTEGVNATKGLTWFVTKLADNFDTIISVLGKLARMFAVYKASMMALKMKDRIDEWVKYRKSISASDGALTQGQKSAKAFGGALKSIGFAVAIELAIALASKLWDVASGAEQAREKFEKYQKAVAYGEKFGGKLVDIIEKDYAKEKLNAELKYSKTRDKKVFDEEMKRAKFNRNARLKFEIQTELENIERQKANAKKLEKQYNIEIDKNGFLQDQRIISQYEGYKSSIKESYAVLSQLYKLKESYNVETKQEVIETNNAVHELKEEKKAVKELTTEFKSLNEYVSESNELFTELSDIMSEREINKFQQKIDEELKIQLKQIEDLGYAEVDKLDELLNEKAELEKKYAKERLGIKLVQIDEEAIAEKEKLKSALEEEYKTLMAQEGLTAKDRKKIKENYNKELEKLEYEFLKIESDAEIKRRIAKEQSADEIVKIEEDKNKELIDKNEEINSALEENANKLNEKTKESVKAMKFDYMKIIEQVTNYFITQADKRIAKIQEEIDAHTKQADVLRELAQQGNINAQQSIAEEERLKAESIARKEKEEKRKQQYLMFTAILQAYSANLENGDDSTTALAKAVASKEIIAQFLNGLDAFYEGTEDTGSTNNPLDIHGGRVAILHDNERVLTKKQNQKIGNYSNEEVADTMEKLRLGRLSDGVQIHTGFGTELFVNELMTIGEKIEDLTNVIKNKPETSIEVDEIIGGVMKLMKTTKTHNSFINTKYVIKP